jgi:hypothetical protein
VELLARDRGRLAHAVETALPVADETSQSTPLKKCVIEAGSPTLSEAARPSRVG